MTARDLILEGYIDLGIIAAGETLNDDLANFGLQKLTRLLDNMNAERAAVYATRFATYTMVPSLQPHTIGPAASSPTFTVTQRPVSIEAANLVLTSVSPNVHQPITVRDADWWSQLAVPGLTTSIPTDLYYAPDWPLGAIYLWPIPTTAYGLELFTRIVLADLALADTITFPPGYRDAITLTWEEMIAPSFPPAQADHELAAKSRARIYANNDVLPTLETRDSGMPGQGKRGSFFSWRRGMPI